MRRLFLCLLILALLPICAMADADAFEPYQSDFSSGSDGWYARSAGSASGAAQDGCFVISGRSESWNSPGRDFVLAPGKEHRISVQVRQDEKAEVTFILSIAKTTNGVASYQNLATGTARQGEWLTLTADYTADACDLSTLYVETSGDPTVSFSIRSFKLSLKSSRFPMDLPSLKDKWADAFDFGAAVTLNEAINRERMDFYASQFSILTCGNEMKVESLLDLNASRKASEEDETAVRVRFDAARPMLSYCEAHGIKVHGHVLCWYQQTPEAFFHVGYDLRKPLADRETMLARLESYIRQVLEGLQQEYPGLIVSWDVVNEAVADGSTQLRACLWTQTVGLDYVNRAFEYARKYAPEGTLLFYNDYNSYYEPKLTGICSLIDSLMADGTIDGYGFQMHMDASNPTNDQLANCLAKVASRGLLLRVSELDVGIPDTSRRSLVAQAQRYADLFEMLKPYHDQLIAVHTWGVSDHLSWRAGNHPLLFDGNDQPKPAFFALMDPASIPVPFEEGVLYGPAREAELTELPTVGNNVLQFAAVYTQNGAVAVRVRVFDGPKSDEDAVTVFVGDQTVTMPRSDEQVEPIRGGYICTFRVENVTLDDGCLPFDVMVNNHGVLTSWSDATNAVEGRQLGVLTLEQEP